MSFSMSLMLLWVTYTRAASSCCVRSRAVRANLTLFPKESCLYVRGLNNFVAIPKGIFQILRLPAISISHITYYPIRVMVVVGN